MAGCLLVTKLVFSFELSAAGAKRGVRSLTMRNVPFRRSTQAQPAEGRPGPIDDNNDDDDDDDDDGNNDGATMMMMISMVTMNMRRMVCNLQQQAWPCSIFGVPSRQVRVLSTLNSFVQLWNHRNIYRSMYQPEHLSQIPVLQGLPLWNLSLIFILNHLRIAALSLNHGQKIC